MQSVRHPKLRFESLEKRLLMAGNVTVTQSGADLLVQGDNADNQIEILGTGIAGQVVVVGQDTGINGVANGSPTFSGVTRDLNVKLAGGNDSVQIDNVATGRDLNIDMGTGVPDPQHPIPAESVILGDNQLVGSVGTGQDLNVTGTSIAVVLQRVFSQRDQIITGGSGIDGIVFNFASSRDLTVHTGAGNDVINTNNLTVRRNMLLDTGTDTDLISMIQTTVYSDTTIQHGNTGMMRSILQANAFKGNLNINTGNATSDVELTACIVGDTCNFRGGSGDDMFQASGVLGGNFNLDGGNGSDNFELRGSQFNNLTATLDGGNDELEVSTDVITGQALADGGSGSDMLQVAGNIGAVKQVNFETFD